MMILRIPSLITNEGDQLIIMHVAIHENACFSMRAAVTLYCRYNRRVRLQYLDSRETTTQTLHKHQMRQKAR